MNEFYYPPSISIDYDSIETQSNTSLQCDNYINFFEMVNCSFSFKSSPENQIQIDYGDNTYSKCKFF